MMVTTYYICWFVTQSETNSSKYGMKETLLNKKNNPEQKNQPYETQIIEEAHTSKTQVSFQFNSNQIKSQLPKDNVSMNV